MPDLPFVKICGITNLQDGILSIDQGAVMLGVVLSPLSPRMGSIDLVKELKGIGAVVATVHTDLDSALTKSSVEDFIQLHFPHGAAEIEKVINNTGKEVISVVQEDDMDQAVARARELIRYGAKFALIDTGKPIDIAFGGRFGFIDHPGIGIAGKISLENIGGVLALRPGFLDVSSKLELYPGKKDPAAVRRFMEVFRDGIRTVQSHS